MSGARVSVRDNGPGISEDEQQRVFESYHRAQQQAGLTASLGLGLTILRELARPMDGDIVYRYQPGESCFVLTLPRAPDS